MKKQSWLNQTAVSILLIGTLLITACNMSGKKTNQKPPGVSFYTGTSSGTESDGIYKITMNNNGHFTKMKKMANADHSSFLTYSPDKRFLLNVNEHQKNNGMGGVESWKIMEDTLDFVSRSVSGGGHPCFIAAGDSGFVLVANYTGGNVGLLKVNTEGKLSVLLDVQQHKGDSVSPRQDAPHAHSAWYEPDGLGIIAADLGTNELWFYSLNTQQQKLISRPPGRLVMTSGAGPRHLAFHPNQNWIYVINELNSTVTQIVKSGGADYRIADSFSTLPKNYTGKNQCAHMLISNDGRFLYASNRGHNSIAIFEIDPKSGSLSLTKNESVRGNWPRHFALSPDGKFLVVANRWSGNLVSFKRDAETGLLEYVDQVQLKEPVCVLF